MLNCSVLESFIYLNFTDITEELSIFLSFFFLRVEMGYSESPKFLCLLLVRRINGGSWKRVFLRSIKHFDVWPHCSTSYFTSSASVSPSLKCSVCTPQSQRFPFYATGWCWVLYSYPWTSLIFKTWVVSINEIQLIAHFFGATQLAGVFAFCRLCFLT